MLTSAGLEIRTLEIVKEEEIAASIDIVFETILEQMGPYGQTPEGVPMSMKLEAWPGGRWYRDLGNNTGHLWGHVQAIKAPTLLEICGPLMMSFPVVSNVQYRLTEEDGVTRVKFVHRAMGLIPAEIIEGERNVGTGWAHFMSQIRERAEQGEMALRGKR
ncbi:MAG TPA: SRPBCC domain-containing protein [Acidobacteriaceae bacterium]|jgi:uncharacterized protein YndB with AHSA1/START domain|nr:SRPBCC domain-containing protein [Acidobacteriaceae bacterium]